MKLNAMRDVGALVRSARRDQGLTQAELAALVGVGREWVVRLERGSPRVQAQKVLDVLSALDLVLNVTRSNQTDQSAARPSVQRAPARKKTGTTSTQSGTGATLRATGKVKTSTRVTKSASSGRWVLRSNSGANKPTKSTGGANEPRKSSRSSGGSNKATASKTLGAARPGRGAEDPFDALFSKKGR